MNAHDFKPGEVILGSYELNEWILTMEALYIDGKFLACYDAQFRSFLWLYERLKAGRIQKARRR